MKRGRKVKEKLMNGLEKATKQSIKILKNTLVAPKAKSTLLLLLLLLLGRLRNRLCTTP